MKKLKMILFALAILISHYAMAQAKPFTNDIRAFKKADSISMPPANSILFIGSSSFTKWKDVQDYFPAHHIINRGFGGSSLPHLIMYADDIIFPYQPKQVVIYCGENDFGEDSVSAQTVVIRFQTLFNLIRSHYKNIPIAYISMKPSPSRKKKAGKNAGSQCCHCTIYGY